MEPRMYSHPDPISHSCLVVVSYKFWIRRTYEITTYQLELLCNFMKNQKYYQKKQESNFL